MKGYANYLLLNAMCDVSVSAMNALTFLKMVGSEEAGRVALLAGTTLAYFKQIAYRHRRPSPELAEKLEEASSGRLDFRSLLSQKRKKKSIS